jgi:hypothetical protein
MPPAIFFISSTHSFFFFNFLRQGLPM